MILTTLNIMAMMAIKLAMKQMRPWTSLTAGIDGSTLFVLADRDSQGNVDRRVITYDLDVHGMYLIGH